MKIATSNGKIVEITYDGEISIATGRYRKETRWKNRDIHWSLFVEKVSKINYTSETMAEFLSAPKDRQDEIKDVGGFVGGSLAGGKRKAETIQARTLLTLDADTVEGSAEAFWDIYTLMYDNAAVVYSTHKHKPDKPRLRLVMPLNRPVTSIEYIAVSRYVAGELGINQFDDTTYEPERLMYWPSTAKDAEYYFEVQDGAWLDVDEVLATYHNWKDSTEWPVSDRQGDAIRREIKKQADPLEKTGIVGAFCRSYGIHKAIETFLPDIYDACDVDNRYTYKNGSTAAGLVVYDDKFAYSHHGTDPVSGILCNAFDLVRIHKFGNLDENVKKVGTRHDRYPSFVAMENFCTQDKSTLRTLAIEKHKSVDEDFEGIEIEDDLNWVEEMDVDAKGNYLCTPNNIELILKNDPKLKDCFAYNLFDDRKALLKMPPWRGFDDKDPFIRDDDESQLRIYFSKKPWCIEARQKITDGLDAVCRINAFHPVRDYLDSQIWDGEKRLDTLLIDYLGAENTELNRWLSRAVFTAAVYRAFEPGTKFDEMLTIVGPQGCGKSTFIEKMAVKRAWFSCSMPTPDKSEEASRHLRGKFIIEVGELVGIRKAELTAVKNFLSASADNFHAPYGKYDVHRPRQCIFFATTNENQFLRDVTGDRRYWVVQVGVIPTKYNLWEELSSEIIGQIWAEAVVSYKNRMSLKMPQNLKNEMDTIQEQYKEVDEWQGIIEEFLDRKLPMNWDVLGREQRKSYFQTDAEDKTYPLGTVIRNSVCVAEILNECPNLGLGQFIDRKTSFRISNVMKGIKGWKALKNGKRFGVYGYQRGWERREEKNGDQTGKTIF